MTELFTLDVPGTPAIASRYDLEWYDGSGRAPLFLDRIPDRPLFFLTFRHIQMNLILCETLIDHPA